MNPAPTTSSRPAVVGVVGGGISGSLAARRLAQGGARVHLFEASSRLGGHVRTVEFAGIAVDVGAEAVHLAAPGPRALLDELDLSGEATSAVPGSSWIWTPRGRRRLPAGVGPTGPTRLRPVLESGVMTVPGLLRAGLEPGAAKARGALDLAPGHDMSVGAFTTMRFGREVTERFVDPLLGGLHSGDVDRLSLRACAPSLVPAATSARSLVLKRRPAPSATPRIAPTFTSFPGGLSTLVERLTADIDLERHLDTAVQRIEPRDGGGYRLTTPDGTHLDVDAVVLAVPAPVATGLLEPVVAEAAAQLGQIRLASTATVVLGFDPADVAGSPALAGTGLLVPSRARSLLKAATHLSTKWPHLHDRGTYVLRMSAGRAGTDVVDGLDDDALLAGLLRDLRDLDGIEATPRHVHIQRWRTGLPQLHVGHVDRLATARAALARDTPGIVLAGASYDGVGLSSCIASAERAATDVLTHLATP